LFSPHVRPSSQRGAVTACCSGGPNRAQRVNMKAEHRDMVVLDADPARLLDALAAWQRPNVDKWIAPPRS
jgi:hypothetical protein